MTGPGQEGIAQSQHVLGATGGRWKKPWRRILLELEGVEGGGARGGLAILLIRQSSHARSMPHQRILVRRQVLRHRRG
eukprot:760962-Hanusia_phi.AAC.2